MKESTRNMLIKPFLFQEAIVVFVLGPIVIFFFRYCSPGATKNFLTVASTAGLAAGVGLLAGFLTKYTSSSRRSGSWKPTPTPRSN